MAKAKKEGKKKRSSKSVLKTLKLVKKNHEILSKIKLSIKNPLLFFIFACTPPTLAAQCITVSTSLCLT